MAISENGSESTQKSGIRFLMKLKESGELPGWQADNKLPVCFQKPQDSESNSATFKFWKAEDPLLYHYEITRQSKSSSWSLKRAWCADANDKLIREFQIP